MLLLVCIVMFFDYTQTKKNKITQQIQFSDKDSGLLIKIISKIIDNPKEKKFRFVKTKIYCMPPFHKLSSFLYSFPSFNFDYHHCIDHNNKINLVPCIN